MKRFFLVVLFFSMAFLLSCSKEDGIGRKQDDSCVLICMTSEATGITHTSAILNGTASIKNAKSSEGNAYFYYSTSQLDAKGLQSSGQKILAGTIPSSGGNFNYNLSNLAAATTYYYVATVNIDDVEELGNVKSFTTEKKSESISSTGNAIDISLTSATLCAYANITADITGDVVLGIIYSVDSNPSLQNGKLLTSKDLDANNMYKVEAKNLEPQTKYYYKSILSNRNLNYYGEVKDFTTKDFNVTTNDATDITEFKATLNGKLSGISIETLNKGVSFRYSKTALDLESLKSSGSTVSGTLNDNGTVTANIESLSYNTQYYYVAFARVNNTYVYGEVKSFMTKDFNVSATTNDATGITELKATLNGKLSVTSIETLNKSVRFLYSKTDSDLESLKSSGSAVSGTLNDNGTVTANLKNLNSNTPNYYVICAKVHDKTVYGEVKSFTTKDFSATVTANSASNVAKLSATLNGKLSVTSTETLSKSVYFYYSMTETTVLGIKTKGTRVSSNLKSNETFSADISNLSNGMNCHYVACAKVYDKEFVSDVKSFKTLSPSCPSGAVNLGLSVCWASCNIGASKPEKYGGYYQWAGTTDVTSTSIYLDFNNCPYHVTSDNSYYSGWTKYNSDSSHGAVDNKTVLDLSDDVAHVKLGGSWRMPTDEEWAELMDTDNCTWTWTTVNGVKGYKVTSEKSGYAGIWIFLPAAGYRYRNYLNDVGYYGKYWSSSRTDSNPANAHMSYGAHFYSNSVSKLFPDDRCNGKSVRPVSE